MTKKNPPPTIQITKDPLPAEIFRQYDIRGIVGETLNTAIASAIGATLGSMIREQGGTHIVVGRDGRFSSASLATALMDGLQYSGLEVMDLGMVPTPLVSFAAVIQKHGNGVMVTGSHNPPRYNGFKIMVNHRTWFGDQLSAILQRHRQGRYTSDSRKVRVRKRMDQIYMSRLTRHTKISRPVKLVVDGGHGVASMLAPILYRMMGCQVVDLFCRVDGSFPNHHPDPSKPENLQHLIAAVKEHRAELGLAFDGDGDRLGVVTSDGEIIYPDRLLLLYAADVLMQNPGAKIIFDVKCTKDLSYYIKRMGGQPILWKTGHALIKAKIKETGALLAGEMSGHFFFPDHWYPFDDAIYAGARLLQIASRWPDASWPLRHLPSNVSTPEITVPMQEGEPTLVVQKLFARKSFFKDANQIITLDGLRVEYPFGFGLVRASNTTPSLVLRFEADSTDHLQQIQQQFHHLLRSQRPDLPWKLN